jgi:hypothetical protein
MYGTMCGNCMGARPFPEPVLMGWRCPGCLCFYAPGTSECPRCNRSEAKWLCDPVVDARNSEEPLPQGGNGMWSSKPTEEQDR